MLVPRTCTLWRLVHASLSNRKHPVHFIRSGKYFTWQIIWSASSGYTFLPLLNKGGPGTPQGKILVRTLHRVCALSSVPWLHYHSCIITEYKIPFTNSVLFTTGSPQNQNHLSWDYLEEIQKWSKCFLFQKVNLSINFTVRFELHTQYVSSFDDIVKSHIIFLCISCS